MEVGWGGPSAPTRWPLCTALEVSGVIGYSCGLAAVPTTSELHRGLASLAAGTLSLLRSRRHYCRSIQTPWTAGLDPRPGVQAHDETQSEQQD
ncbi:unnamed protein product [Boreogadus saida]